MSNKQKVRDNKIYFGTISIVFSALAFYVSYLHFYIKDQCSYGGSRLSWLFAIVCESLGVAGMAALWLLIGIIAFSLGVGILLSKKGK